MRQLRVVIGLAVVVALAAPAAVRADQNIYAKDLADAQRALAREEHRVEVATATLGTSQAALPGARARAARLRAVADQRTQAVEHATTAATAAHAAEQKARQHALGRVRAVNLAAARATARWRNARGAWVALSATFVALAIAVVLLMLALRDQRPRWERDARRRSLQLGVAVGGYLAGLIVALRLARAWQVSVVALFAAGIGVSALVIATAIGWRSETPREPSRRPGVLWWAAGAALCAVLLAAGIAAIQSRPEPDRLGAGVLALARQATSNAPMPASVQALEQRVRVLSVGADLAEVRAARAEGRRDALERTYHHAVKTQADGVIAVKAVTDAVSSLQSEYDDYQQLLAPLPSADIPAPTTQNFGSGLGTVGLCADGTLSDSIGRPGACSHHGGVG